MHRVVTSDPPACFLTGIKLLERVGFIDAERLMEELVPFLDHGPKV
jgi:hypothetical protein